MKHILMLINWKMVNIMEEALANLDNEIDNYKVKF